MIIYQLQLKILEDYAKETIKIAKDKFYHMLIPSFIKLFQDSLYKEVN